MEIHTSELLRIANQLSLDVANQLSQAPNLIFQVRHTSIHNGYKIENMTDAAYIMSSSSSDETSSDDDQRN